MIKSLQTWACPYVSLCSSTWDWWLGPFRGAQQAEGLSPRSLRAPLAVSQSLYEFCEKMLLLFGFFGKILFFPESLFCFVENTWFCEDPSFLIEKPVLFPWVCRASKSSESTDLQNYGVSTNLFAAHFATVQVTEWYSCLPKMNPSVGNPRKKHRQPAHKPVRAVVHDY